MTSRYISFFICHIVMFLLSAQTLTAQDSSHFRLLDATTGIPISEATFEFADQKGTSDHAGMITFNFIEGPIMQVSHVAYGQHRLSSKDLGDAIESGMYFIESRDIHLYPVTVISVRPKVRQTESLDLDERDKMAYDGGALLTQSPLVGAIRKSGNYGVDPVLRGFKYDQLNIVLNGVQCASAACPNRMDPPTSQMAPNMLDRVEILKGPHALRFGGAFGGTINFIPEPHRFSAMQEMYGRISGGYENNGAMLRSEGMIGFRHKRYDIGLFGSWSQGDDYKSGSGNTVQSDFQRGSFGVDIGLKLSDRQKLRVSATRNVARDADFPALAMDLREDDTWLFSARHDMDFSEGPLSSWNTSVFGSFVDHLMDNLLKPLDPRMLNALTNAKTYHYGGRTEGIWHFQNSSLYAGADIRAEGAEGTRVREFLLGPNAGKTFYDNAWQDGRVFRAGAFAEYHLRQERFKWIISGRLELNSADIADPEPEFTEVYPDIRATQVNPSLSIGGVMDLGNDMQAGVWLGRAQRSGSMTERFINYFPVGQDPFEMLGNPQLDPEVNYQADLNFGWQTRSTALDLDLFAGYMQDFISSVIDNALTPRLPNSPGVRQFVNIEHAFKTGFELTWSQEMPAGLSQHLSMAYTYGQDLERDEPLPEIAPLDVRYQLSGRFVNDRLTPEISLRHVIRQSRISREFGETETPAFTLLDVKVSYALFSQAGITLGVQNLLDETYYEHLSRSVRGSAAPIYAPGRNVYFAFHVTFD